MAKYLTDRQDRKLEEMARKLDGLTGRNNRLPSPSSQITGTDFGSVIVPRTTIPAATRTVQAGSDLFTPGEGTAYLFKRATGGEIEPRLDRAGAVIFRTVYNLSGKSYEPNPAGGTDYIGPTTSVLFAVMDRSGKLIIPADEEADGVFDVSADTGSAVTIDPKDTLDFDTTDQDWDVEANGTQADRGLVVKVEQDGGDSTIKRLKHAIDKSPLQNIVLSGAKTSGTTPVLVRSGTRNSIELEASSSSITTLTGGAGKITYAVSNPLSTIEDDAASTQSLNYQDTLKFTADVGNFAVTKASSTVTVNLSNSVSGLSIGAVIMGVLAPVTDTGKEYMDRGGAADTDWALMDGASNATPGSAIQMATASGTEAEFFVRALSGTSAATNTRFGRDSTALTADPDDDEVDLAISDHVDHFHNVNADTCDEDWSTKTDAIEFQFTVANKRTSGAVDTGQSPTTLTHILTLTNHQGSAADRIEMTPDHKKLHYFERVA